MKSTITTQLAKYSKWEGCLRTNILFCALIWKKYISPLQMDYTEETRLERESSLTLKSPQWKVWVWRLDLSCVKEFSTVREVFILSESFLLFNHDPKPGLTLSKSGGILDSRTKSFGVLSAVAQQSHAFSITHAIIIIVNEVCVYLYVIITCFKLFRYQHFFL